MSRPHPPGCPEGDSTSIPDHPICSSASRGSYSSHGVDPGLQTYSHDPPGCSPGCTPPHPAHYPRAIFPCQHPPPSRPTPLARGCGTGRPNHSASLGAAKTLGAEAPETPSLRKPRSPPSNYGWSSVPHSPCLFSQTGAGLVGYWGASRLEFTRGHRLIPHAEVFDAEATAALEGLQAALASVQAKYSTEWV